MEEGLVSMLAQFGPAGLIGFLWLYERRQSAARERQLDEAHRAVRALDEHRGSLLEVVRDNTRAMISLEQSQRGLVELLKK